MTRRRQLLLAVLFLMMGSYFAYNYLYKDHRDITTESSQLEIAAPYLLERFKSNDAEELLNSTITVVGMITQIESAAITLDSNVFCSFNSELKNLKINDRVSIKGRCIGYDDLLEIVKLDQCILIK
jgi:hypothetical protein